MWIFRAINWCLCLGLRCTAWVTNRAHERLKSGPGARLALASDHELLAEAKRRGLLRKKRKPQVSPHFVPETRTVRIEEPEVILAIKAVTVLQQMPESKAEALVRQAMGKWTAKRKPTADELAALVLRPA